MHPWKYADGQSTVVFYNTISGVYLEIWQKYDVGNIFSSGSPQEEREVDDSLTMKSKTILSFSTNLLSDIKAGKGKNDTFDRMGIWTMVNEGPIAALKSDSNPKNRIFLLPNGFLYICKAGALVVESCQLKITSTLKAQKYLQPIAPAPPAAVVVRCLKCLS